MSAVVSVDTRFAITETIEDEGIMVTGHPRIWLDGNVLLWPPGNVDRSVIIPPGDDWTRHECTVLKDKIETFEEMLVQERFYTKHRNSDSFRRQQDRKQLKRKHPVMANMSDSALIDVNDLADAIDNSTAKNALKAGPISVEDLPFKQANRYHNGCLDTFTMKPNKGTVRKPGDKAIKKPIPHLKSVTKASKLKMHQADGVTKPKLPRFDNFLKAGSAKSTMHQANDVNKPKLPRYDNFLKSGKVKSKMHHANDVNIPKLPRYDNFLKSGNVKSKTHPEANDVNQPKLPRYDNFLKSANSRSSGLHIENLTVSSGKIRWAPSATITKEQYLKKLAETNEVELALPENSGFTSKQNTAKSNSTEDEEIDCGADEERGTQYGSKNSIEYEKYETSFCAFDDQRGEKDESSDNYETRITERINPRAVINVIDDVIVKPATNVPSDGHISFENRILHELRVLTENQRTFEERIEKRLNNFYKDQSRMQYSYSPNPNAQNPSSQNPYAPHPYAPNPYAPNLHAPNPYAYVSQIRNYRQHHQQQPVAPAPHGVVDFEDFELFDKNFPIGVVEGIEELEWNVRRDLEFKFLLKSRLNEISGKNVEKTIRLKMKYLFADVALEWYTWNGTIKKKPFKKLRSLKNLIFQSVRVDFINYKYKDFKSYMITWIKHAKSRQRTVTYSYPNKKTKSHESSNEDDGDGDSNDDDDGDDDDGDGYDEEN